MRGAGIGLIGLLLCAGITFYLMFGGPGNPGTVRTDLEARKQANEFGNQISGKDVNGEIVTKSIAFQAGSRGIEVSNVTRGGAFDMKYGLQSGDVILEIGPLDAKQQASDNGTADAYLRDAYARGEQLVVNRGVQQLTLPDQRQTAPTVAGAAPVKPKTATGSALDLVHQIETH